MHRHRLSGMIKALWLSLSNYHSIGRIQSYQHVDKVVFEGYTSHFAHDAKRGNASLIYEQPRPMYEPCVLSFSSKLEYNSSNK